MFHGKIQYAEHDNLCVIKLVGDIRYTISEEFNDFVEGLFTKEYIEEILIDMTQTHYIDSTNLGILAKIANHERAEKHGKATIISDNEEILHLFKIMCFDQVFIILHTLDHEQEIDFTSIKETDHEHTKRSLIILEAHKTLMEMNEKNADTFRPVVEEMKKDLGL